MDPVAASSVTEGRDYDGLRLVARIARLWRSSAETRPSPSSSDGEGWIQCDGCFRWRKGVNVAPYANGLCQRWFCKDANRACQEPCDHCRVPNCTCTPSQSYCGYATSGYSLPDGFSVLIRFRHADDIEIGKPWLTYRSWCKACGTKSKGMDRRDYMQKWLTEHQAHNASWKGLSVEAFDFKVDARTRELYMTYIKLHKRGEMKRGLRETVKAKSAAMTEDEREGLKALLEMVEVSRFFDEKVVENARVFGNKTPKKRVLPVANSMPPPLPMKRSSRKTRQPQWMSHGTQWVMDDLLLDLKTPIHMAPAVVPRVVVNPRRNVVEEDVAQTNNPPEMVLPGRLARNLTAPKDAESLVLNPAAAPVVRRPPPLESRVITMPPCPYGPIRPSGFVAASPNGLSWRPERRNTFVGVPNAPTVPALGLSVTSALELPIHQWNVPFLNHTPEPSFLMNRNDDHHAVPGNISQRREHSSKDFQPVVNSMNRYDNRRRFC